MGLLLSHHTLFSVLASRTTNLSVAERPVCWPVRTTKGPFFAMRFAGKHMRDNGRIINISTVNTRIVPAKASLYAGSKGALELFSRVAAYEFGGRGITVNIVSPGATDTQMLHDANPGDTFESTVAFTALKRLGQPADVADVVALLAGPDAHWITGQNITASGGLML